MRRCSAIWVLLVSGCAPPVTIAPAAPIAPAALPPVTPPPAATTTREPDPVPAPTPKTGSFDLRTASTQYDFRLVLKAGCPGIASQRDGCAGELIIFPKGSTVEAQREALESIWVTLDSDGEPLVNSANLEENQGTINVGDYNFDGREDFAVQVGHDGPYGSPTYSVFLSAPDGRFQRSDALSKLTEHALGLFQVDPKGQRLVTFNKSGCCIHEREELEVVKNKPAPVLRVVEDASRDEFVTETREWLVKGKWHRKTTRRAAQPD